VRVLFVCFPSPSHFFPLVPLAWALRAGGHDVRVASSPSFEPHLLRSGLAAALVGDSVDLGRIWAGQAGAPAADADARTRIGHAAARGERAMAMFTRVADAMLPDLLSLGEHWAPDLVVFEPRAYAGPVVADRLTVPAIRQLWGTDYTYLRREVETPMLAGFARRHGLALDELHGRHTVDPCPAALQIPQAPADRALMRYVPYNGPGAEPSWLRAANGRPRVCLTWGTTFGTTAGHVHPAQRALDALSTMDVDVIVAVAPNQRHLISDVGGGVRVVEAMPLHLLLPGCAAIVHQGGAGTTNTALMSGVPQLVVPTIADEPLNGERVAAAGVGACVPQPEATPDRLAYELGNLIGDALVRMRTEQARDEAAAQPSPTAVADALVTSTLPA
jgi:UDP:flavonoid glycosyltransferase YjiC (YdhE family)